MNTTGALASDSDAGVEQLMFERVRAMTITDKANVIHSLSRSCIALATAGIKQRHPHATSHEVRLRLLVLTAGPELVLAAYGWDANVEGF